MENRQDFDEEIRQGEWMAMGTKSLKLHPDFTVICGRDAASVL